jgi:hypothetical protein
MKELGIEEGQSGSREAENAGDLILKAFTHYEDEEEERGGKNCSRR